MRRDSALQIGRFVRFHMLPPCPRPSLGHADHLAAAFFFHLCIDLRLDQLISLLSTGTVVA